VWPAQFRIWSAGCAAGQEAWSIAILLEEASTARDNKPGAYHIFATDRAEDELVLARRGIYSASALGNVRQRQLECCFFRQGDTYAVTDRLKDKVDFSTYDLLDLNSSSPAESIYGNFDLILCCNVLYYYRPEIQQRILDKLKRNLAAGGYLVTGEAERQFVVSGSGLNAITPAMSIFKRSPYRR